MKRHTDTSSLCILCTQTYGGINKEREREREIYIYMYSM